MSKPKPIQISIPTPCSQNRDEMTRTTEGRFCTHCQKTVIDFTTWSDAALYNFFSKNTGKVCGTFFEDQLNRPINIPYQPHSKLYRITIALGLTLIFTQTPNVLAQNRPPKTEQTSLLKLSELHDNNPGEIGGIVLNDKKEIFPGVLIQVYQDHILIGSVITDTDGDFTIKPLEPGYYDITISHNGYNDLEVTGIIVSHRNRTTQNAVLQRIGVNELPGIRIVQYRRPLVDGDVHEMQKYTSYRIPDTTLTHPISCIIAPHQEHIAPINDSVINNLQQHTYDNKQNGKLDNDNPTKKTFSRDEINRTPQ